MANYATVSQELNGIRRMPYGVARTAAAEAITRRIETDGPKEKLPEALLDLIEAYTFTDEGHKAFVPFAQLLRIWDENPEHFDTADQRNFFWEFKWVASDLPMYPQISREQAEAFLTDMERRFSLAGHGLSSVRMSRFGWEWQTGGDDAEAARLEWITGTRDGFEDCDACMTGQQVDYFTRTGRYAEAVALALTLKGECNQEPMRTRYALSLAALLDGDPELALKAYHGAVASDRGESSDYGSSRGLGFETLCRGGRLRQALRALRNDYTRLLRRGDTPMRHLRFLLGVLSGLSANLDQGNLETGLREPEWRTVSDLHSWVLIEARGLARKFDQRNGNDFWSKAIDRALTAKLAETPLPEESLAISEADHSGDGQAISGSGSEADSARPVEDDVSAEQSDGASKLIQAEKRTVQKDHLHAAKLYVEAAREFEDEGWLDKAGIAYAEAAQHCALSDQDETAHKLFAQAISLLKGGSEEEARTVILSAWAPIAARMDDYPELLAALNAELTGYEEFTSEGLSDDLAERKRSEWVSRSATLRDTLARSIMSAPPLSRRDGLDSSRAITEANRAAEDFAGLGMISDASHAFWLAGKAQSELGDTVNSIWSFESAFEGFTYCGDRAQRIKVADELIELLRLAGLPERADEIIAQL